MSIDKIINHGNQLNICEDIRFINRRKNFTQILVDRKYLQLENVMCCALFGKEYFQKKKILNLKLPPELLNKIINLENRIETLSEENNIRSSCQEGYTRAYVTNQTKIIDFTHKCRIFSDIKPKAMLLVTLAYHGFWIYDNGCGHYWQAKTITFIDNSEEN